MFNTTNRFNRRIGFVRAALLVAAMVAVNAQSPRPRAREFGVAPGVLPPGPLNAITDVAGVKVGHRTVISGDDVRTGVTAIVPHGGNLFQEKSPAAVYVFNAFGKLIGSTQVVVWLAKSAMVKKPPLACENSTMRRAMSPL